MLTLMTLVSVLSVLPLMAFSSSTATISNANFANVTNSIAEVRQLVAKDFVTVKGNEASKGIIRNDAQVYNYVAKGATVTDTDGKAWIPRIMSESLSATHISPDAMKEEANEVASAVSVSPSIIKVNTPNNTGIEASFFVTRNGDVFIWPPYEYDDALYVTTNQYICEESGDGMYVVGQGNPVSYDDIDLEDIKGIIFEDKKYDYATDKYIVYDDVTVLIDSKHAEPQISINSITDASVLEKTPAVYYKDMPNAKSPVGLETNEMYRGK